MNCRCLALFLIVSCWTPTLSAADLTATLGKRAVVLADGQHGLGAFPDEPICVISKQPLRFLMVAGNRTVLMEGRSFEAAKPVKNVLEPSGKSGTFDQGYAGIGGVVEGKRNELLAFFHAEKPTGGKNTEGVIRFYASIGQAVSTDGGNSFTKVGLVLTGRPEDPNWKGTAQGNADPSACVDHTGEWLFCYYTEHSRRDPATGKTRSVITCMARSKVSDGGKPGTWKKYFSGSFSEPGLGGKDSEVANCWAPQVTYIPQMKKYVMLGSRGGVVLYTSDDGIKWQNGTLLFRMTDVPMIGKEFAVHPSLYLERATATQANGFLFYGYTPSPDGEQRAGRHAFVKNPITLKLGDSEGADSLKERLAGTRWTNSAKGSFDWTRDGRLLVRGVDRKWKPLDANRAQVTFGSDHIDTLVFDSSFKTFKQLIKGGPSSLDGKLIE